MYNADAKLGGAINVYRNIWVYPEGTIKLLEARANDPDRTLINWSSGSAKRQCDTIDLTWLKNNSSDSLLHHVYDQYHTILAEYSKSYYADYTINENGFTNDAYNIIRYKPGNQYHAHYDGNTKLGRHISVILFLNGDFGGGELYFNHFDITIKPEAGMLVLFPSNFAYRYEELPVTKGTKYAIATWLHDRPNT